MKGNETVIKHLNQVLKNELTAINQYFLHSKMFKDWGYAKLGDYEDKESIDEMKHADQIILLKEYHNYYYLHDHLHT